MSHADTDPIARITAAMFGQLLNKLEQKGVLDKKDIEQMAAAATQALQVPASPDAFDGMHGRYEDGADNQ